MADRADAPADRPVLLVMDVQRGIVDRYADNDGYLERLSTAIGAGPPGHRAPPRATRW